jgi:flagellar hook-associated protein 1 FlgK
MISTLGALQSAYSGLAAAQMGIDVTGQNIDNSDTTGYIREEVEQSALGAPAQVGPATGSLQPGQGVAVTGIVQLGSSLLDAQVRTTNASAGYSGTVSSALTQIETTLGEPSTDAISGQLQSFWSAWQDVSNQPGSEAPAGALLGQANTLVTQISSAYQSVDQQWSDTNSDLTAKVGQLNSDASQVAQLNGQIESTLASGGDANELIDARNNAVADMATLAGATVTQNSNGTINVSIGGSNMVQGTTSRTLEVTGTTSLEGTSTNPVQLVWSDQTSGPALNPTTGAIAGDLSLLAPADATGNGGAYAETAAQLNTLASSLASQVNAVSETGATSTGATGQDFFALASGVPAALGLSVIPTSASGIAVANPSLGSADGSVADEISQLGSASGSPDAGWSSFIVSLGTASQTATQQSTLDQSAQSAATTAQQSQESVDLDQESMNLIAYQHAYEGSARVMTTLDDMLDQLINHTGIVGLES